VVDPKLGHAFPDWLYVSHQARLQPDDALGDTVLGAAVSQVIQAFPEDSRLSELRPCVKYKLRTSDNQCIFPIRVGGSTEFEVKERKDCVLTPYTKAVRTALRDASSGGRFLLATTEAMIAEKPEKKAPLGMPPGGGGMGDMDF
jgi:hypothetical protein